MVLPVEKPKVLLFCATALVFLAGIEGRGCGGWSSCGRNLGRPYRHGNYYFNRRPHGHGLMSDIFSMPIYFNTLYRQSQQASQQADDRVAQDRPSSSPRYEMYEGEDGGMELVLEVPGVSASDLSVELEDDGRVLRIHGSRQHHSPRGSSSFESKFDQMFRIDEHVDVDGLSVTLSSGLLRISAPRKERNVRNIPIDVVDVEEEGVEPQVLKASDKGGDKLAKRLDQAQEESQEVLDGLTITEDDN